MIFSGEREYFGSEKFALKDTQSLSAVEGGGEDDTLPLGAPNFSGLVPPNCP